MNVDRPVISLEDKTFVDALRYFNPLLIFASLHVNDMKASLNDSEHVGYKHEAVQPILTCTQVKSQL